MRLDRGAAVAQALTVPTAQGADSTPPWVDRLPPLPKERKHWSETGTKGLSRSTKGRRSGAEELVVSGTVEHAQSAVGTHDPLLAQPLYFQSAEGQMAPVFVSTECALQDCTRWDRFEPCCMPWQKIPRCCSISIRRPIIGIIRMKILPVSCSSCSPWGKATIPKQTSSRRREPLPDGISIIRTGAFRVDRRWHDDGRKEVFGKSGSFDGDDILSLTLEQPQVARYLVRKLWREFISDSPDSVEVDRLAGSFRRSDYNMAALLNDLFLTPQFWASENRGCLIKSPVDLAGGNGAALQSADRGAAATCPVRTPAWTGSVRSAQREGMAGGTRWITTSIFWIGRRCCTRAIRGHETGHGPTGREDGERWSRRMAHLGSPQNRFDSGASDAASLTPVHPPDRRR